MSDKVSTVKEGEIDLMELAKVLWTQKKLIFKITGIFFIMGLIIALTSKVEYESYCKLLPESQEVGPELGGLGGLASLAGFDLSGIGGAQALSPELYPEIVGSVPFLEKLINTPVYFENKDTTVTCFEYFKEIDRPSFLNNIADYTIGLPGKIKKLFRSKEGQLNEYNMIRFSKEEWEIYEGFSERLVVSVDKNTGIIVVRVEIPDAVAAAQLTDRLVKNLSRQIIDYKSQRALLNLEFINKLFNDAQIQYQEKQEQLALFTDRNRNITNSIVQTEYERLQNEMNISFEVYKGLASQLEQAKIKVKEETPVFTILEPVQIPVDKSKPKRILILTLTTILGTGSCIFLFTVKYLREKQISII